MAVSGSVFLMCRNPKRPVVFSTLGHTPRRSSESTHPVTPCRLRELEREREREREREFDHPLPITPRFSVGDEVSVEIDGVKRMLHARIHSAGHLLDTAFSNIGVTYLEPSKVGQKSVCMPPMVLL